MFKWQVDYKVTQKRRGKTNTRNAICPYENQAGLCYIKAASMSAVTTKVAFIGKNCMNEHSLV